MPVLVIVELPGGSSELDEVLIEAWDLTGRPPSGNRLRLSGPTEDGWRVITLWESAEQFQHFMEDRLHLTLEDAGGQQPTVTMWDIEKVHQFD